LDYDFLDILKRYWGYGEFRPLQGDIIQSVAEGKDTLGLMPTGGGKSLTFQVPTLAMKGVCIVVTPLIALMKDQVENLKKRQIPAAAVYSGQSRDEMLRTLDNCVLEACKFLYVSPERLATPVFIEKLRQMTVCLIAVDESHCISQWGYDFRPSYLRIAGIREELPGVPVLALTATATPEVVGDIQEKLHFRQPNVFRKSFYRSNLAYVVRTIENKEEYLLRILSRVPGTSVVYVRNRKKTKEVAEFLLNNGISAEYFHAGLPEAEKNERQRRWTSGKTRVIVSTNAFGMGIDKPDVRTVVHMDLPDSLEAYFQEAGRAGRDEKKAFAVLLYNNADATKIKKRISDTFPQKDFIRKVYDALGNYYQIGAGSGLDTVFAFDLADFCTQFRLPLLMTFNALKILQQAGYVELTDEQENASSVLFTVDKDELYHTKHSDEQEKLIHILLRSYTGLFTDPARISEELLAQRLRWSRDKLYQALTGLSKEKIIRYIPRKRTPLLVFTREREEGKDIALGKEAYDDRRDRYVKRAGSVLGYAREEHICRSKILLAYFGEKNADNCGQCDVCLKRKETELSADEFESIRNAIREALATQALTVDKLLKQIAYKEKKVLQVLSFMTDNRQVSEDETMRLNYIK
jgi:ATP-dependent DNA helicase RecQ